MANTIQSAGYFEEQEVHLVTLVNANGNHARILTLGATLHALTVKDRNGVFKDIIVAPENMAYYLEPFHEVPYYFGASIGRYAGRIGNGGFMLNGTRFELPHENNVHLHGGRNGLHHKVWYIDEIVEGKTPQITLSCASPHLEEGYPGNIIVSVTYILEEDGTFHIRYRAQTDRDTVINLTNHAYVNLGSESVLHHELFVNSNQYLEVHKNLLPTGKIHDACDTPYDFSTQKSLEAIKHINGLDDTFILRENYPRQAGIVYFAPSSGIEMRIGTNQPAVVIFAPERLMLPEPLKQDYWNKNNFPSICFETQNFPDAPNHAHFPSSVLKKGEEYNNDTTFLFNLRY